MNIDWADALNWVNIAVNKAVGQPLKAPEIVILQGTWRGLTYERMAAGSEYSTNYLMRDVAPKLWKQLSGVFGCPVGKTNFRVVLDNYMTQNAAQTSGLSFGSATDESALPLLSSLPNVKDSDRTPPPVQPATERFSTAFPGALSKQSLNTPFYSDGRRLQDVEMSPLFDCGYEEELGQIAQWLQPASPLDKMAPDKMTQSVPAANRPLLQQNRTANTKGCFIGIWGLKGVGKSLLCEKVVVRLGDRFDAVVWRSLRRKPSLDDFCSSILKTLRRETQPNSPSSLPSFSSPPDLPQTFPSDLRQDSFQTQESSQAVDQLLSVMAQHAVLLIIENAEDILQPMMLAGDYLPGYSPYGEFFRAVATSCSCIILTGTEGPTDCVTQTGHYKNHYSIYLNGLDPQPATALLSHESLETPEHWPTLIERYQGHPFALQSAARVIREMFNGRVDIFLQQTSSLFTDVIRLLAPSFDRLSELELTILDWLASQKKPIPLVEIRQTLPTPIDSTNLISALDSLKQRSCLSIRSEVTPPEFQLTPLVKAYAVHRLMAQFKGDFKHSEFNSRGTQPNAVSPSVETTPNTNIINPNVISLSPHTPQSVHLSQWFHARFEPTWKPLSQLFEASSVLPSTRLRNTYHLKDETFIKRYKSVALGVMYKNEQSAYGPIDELEIGKEQIGNAQIDKGKSGSNSVEQVIADSMSTQLSITLVVAVRQKDEDLYEICVQAQPEQDADTLPIGLALALVDAQQNTLSVVHSARANSFIQLPYFQGQLAEGFDIKLQLSEYSHTETFLI